MWVAVVRELGGIPSHGIDRHYRPVHILCFTDTVPHHHRSEDVPCRALQPGLLWRTSRVGGRGVGRHYHRALLPAGCVPGDQTHAQLRARGRGWRLLLSHGRMAPLRPQVV